MTGQEHVKWTEEKRNALAKRIRDFRKSVREEGQGIKPSTFNQIWERDIWNAPERVTPPALMRQIQEVAEFVATPVPDLTMDDGYSRCGQEDYEAERREAAAEHVHMLLDAYIYQLREKYYV